MQKSLAGLCVVIAVILVMPLKPRAGHRSEDSIVTIDKLRYGFELNEYNPGINPYSHIRLAGFQNVATCEKSLPEKDIFKISYRDSNEPNWSVEAYIQKGRVRYLTLSRFSPSDLYVYVIIRLIYKEAGDNLNAEPRLRRVLNPDLDYSSRIETYFNLTSTEAYYLTLGPCDNKQ